MDPISLIGTGVSMASSMLDVLNYVRGIKGSGIISAIFNEEGNRTDGSDKILIEKHPGRTEGVWWYSVKEVPEYIFNRIPLTSSCLQEIAGCVAGEVNPHAKYWRWLAIPQQGVIIGGGQEPPNIKVSFLIIGYKPKALMKHFSSQT